MIAVGCDQGGFELKQEILKYLQEQKIEYKDFGCYSTASVDYPAYARKVAEAVAAGDFEKGIPVSYTHLDVYKRQVPECGRLPG